MRDFLKAAPVALAILGLAVAPAFAQSASRAGVVGSISGDSGSVLVNRGGSVLELVVGSDLFPGDQIFTRSSGEVTIQFTGCTRTLSSLNSLTVSGDVCSAPIQALQASDTIAGVSVGGTGFGGIVIPVALGVVALGAAIGGGDDSSSP